jgi:hypothetical protein
MNRTHTLHNAPQPRRRLLLGLGLVILVVGAIAVYTWLAAQPTEPVSISGVVTAREALPAAASLAQEWQSDAQLIAIAGEWMEVDGQPHGRSIQWTFQFFSPSARQVAIIDVFDGVATQVGKSHASGAPVVSDEAWPIDSDRACGIWLENGGRRMLERHPDASLVMSLYVPSEGERPIWHVVGIVAGTKNALILMIDAADGTVASQ